ncbi:MAG: hypothetical protein DRN55_06300, partial [Thermoplasmata archaeon]
MFTECESILPKRLFGILLAVLFLFPPLPGGSAGSSAAMDERGVVRAEDVYGKVGGLLSGFFVENRGQLSSDEIYLYGGVGNLKVGFAESYVVYAYYRGEDRCEEEVYGDSYPGGRIYVYRVYFEGGGAVPRGMDRKSFYFNYFLGNDSSRWASFVPAYGEVLYENLYPNIDLRFYFTDKGLKYDFIVHPGGEV